MKEFKIRVTQPLEGFYEGEITLKAKSKKEFLKIIQDLPQSELEDLAENWVRGDEYWSGGNIELHLDSIKEI